MKISIKFAYAIRFHKSPRTRKDLVHQEFENLEVEIPEISESDFPVAGILKKWDGTLTEYRYHNGRFWKADDAIPDRMRSFRNHISESKAEAEYYEAVKANTIYVLDDTRQEVLDEINAETAKYLSYGGYCWREVYEPVFRINTGFDGKTSIRTMPAPDHVGNNHSNVRNAKDIGWDMDVEYQEKMEVLMPDAFTYGYDDAILNESIIRVVMSFWSSSSLGLLAPVFLQKIIPEVLKRVKKANDLPYTFTFEQVFQITSDIMDEIEIK